VSRPNRGTGSLRVSAHSGHEIRESRGSTRLRTPPHARRLRLAARLVPAVRASARLTSARPRSVPPAGCGAGHLSGTPRSPLPPSGEQAHRRPAHFVRGTSASLATDHSGRAAPSRALGRRSGLKCMTNGRSVHETVTVGISRRVTVPGPGFVQSTRHPPSRSELSYSRLRRFTVVPQQCITPRGHALMAGNSAILMTAQLKT
jgi:hypothetical protein